MLSAEQLKGEFKRLFVHFHHPCTLFKKAAPYYSFSMSVSVMN
jgi:hypothetical protein